MRLPFFWIDAFAERIFTGNPAGVVPLDAWLPDDVLQRIAFEKGLAETAFVVRRGLVEFALRWLTPTTEVDLCGHATLAAAHVLFATEAVTSDSVSFTTRSGVLRVTQRSDGRLELDLPATPIAPVADAAWSARVAAAIGGARVTGLSESRFDWCAELAGEAGVRDVRPDFGAIAALGKRGLIVTARGGGNGADFVSRFFAPRIGVPEDPVTGSAHCALTPFWAARLGRTRLHARQLSERGGEIECTLAGERVRLAGRAVLYLRGEITLP